MNWQRWIRPGLVVTAIIAIFAVVMEAGTIERDLGTRVAARLAAEGQGWASVEASARDLTIRGTAPSTESQALAVRLAAEVRGVRAVGDDSELLPLALPYVWSARWDGQSIVLAGAVPSQGLRASVLAAARRAFPEAEILDGMELARGATPAFNTATTFAFEQLSELAVGMVTLTDATLAVSGRAADADSYAEVRSALAGELPSPMGLGPVEILPAPADPFVWSVSLDENAATLAGFVPNELVQKSLVETIRVMFPGLPAVDQTAIASGEPAGFAEAARFAIEALTRLSRGGATLDGLTLDIAGVAKSVDDYEALRAIIAGPLPVGMQVIAADVAPAMASEYGWRGEIAEGRVTLSGFVPSQERRAELAELARDLFNGATVDDRVHVAAGEPLMDWIGAIKFAMGQLAKLHRGRVALGDKTYSIQGEAANADAYLAILDANARTLPASLELEKADVVPPHAALYRFVAVRRGRGVVLAGHVPGEEGRWDILAAARRNFGAVPVIDDLALASGAPDGFVEAAIAGVRAVNRLTGGRVAMVGQAVTIEGLAYHPAAAEEIEADLEATVPAGYTVTSRTVSTGQPRQPVATDHCGDLLQAVLHTGSIEFSGDRADIAPDSYGVLDRASSLLTRCRDAIVEIGAHSDSDGSASDNRERTQVRAEAIVDFLVDAGVKRERLAAVGYGEDQPIADNSTPEGKAANRRIEFTVELQGGG